MHPIAQNYINNKIVDKLEARTQKLIDLGLYEKVYSKDGTYSEQYPESEWSEEQNKLLYFKKVAIDVTDSDYEEIMKYTTTAESTKPNAVAKIFKVMAWIVFIGGFILGLVCGRDPFDDEFSIIYALIFWAVSFINGMFLLGLSEIISLLNDIKYKR